MMSEAAAPAEAPAAPILHGAPRVPATHPRPGDAIRVPGAPNALDASRPVDELAADVAALIHKCPDIYDFGGALVKIGRPRSDQPHRPVLIDSISLNAAIKPVVTFGRVAPDGNTMRAQPPSGVVGRVCRLGSWPGLRRLQGLAECPYLRPDGTIVNLSGHDPATGVYLLRSLNAPVKGSPSREDAVAAAKALLGAFARLPFDGARAAAAALASVLATFARHAIDGPVPFAVVDASYAAAGGALTPARALARIALGYDAPADLVPGTPGLVAGLVADLAQDATRAVVLGGEHTASMGGAVAEALQADTWSGDWGAAWPSVALPLRTVGFISGIDVDVSSELARRSVRVDLRASASAKSLLTRAGYQDTVTKIAQNRPSLAGHALAILRGFFTAGCPQHGGSEHPLFPGWDRLVRSAVIWATDVDPVDPSTFAEAPKPAKARKS